MINFRKALCKEAKKGGLIYKICGCSRYEPPAPKLVEVYVCLESRKLLRAGICPAVDVVKMYEKDIPAPCDLSHVVKADYPKKAIPGPPFIGLSFYQIITATREAIVWFLDQLVEAGGNVTEAFVLGSWGGLEDWQPFERRKDSTYPDYPLVYDLSKWRPEVWDKWQFFFEECFKRNILLILRLHDWCSMKNGASLKKLAFRACVQRDGLFKENLMGQPPLTGGLWGEPIRWWYRERFNKPLAAAILTARENTASTFDVAWPIIVPMNEADVLKNADETESWADQANLKFHTFYQSNAGSIFGDGMIISTSRSFGLLAALGERMEIHGCNSPERLLQYEQRYRYYEWWPNGDGPDPYAMGAEGDNISKRLPSISQAKDMGKIIDDKRLWGWCGFARETEHVTPAYIRLAKFDVVRAMREGFNA